MIVRAIVTAILTWLVLVILLHMAIFALSAIYRQRGPGWIEQVQEAGIYRALVFVGAVLMYPVILPVVLHMRLRRRRMLIALMRSDPAATERLMQRIARYEAEEK